MIKVPFFSVDYTTLPAGLYLRETKTTSLLSGYKVWDLRFSAPSSSRYLEGRSMNTIVNIMAYKLREYLGNGYITFAPLADHTGFEFITRKRVSFNRLKVALVEAIEDAVPIVTKDEIPSIAESARPTYYECKPASDWLWEFHNVILNQEN